MVEASLWLWWSIVKEQATSEDCWYGLDCRKQTDPDHVFRFNHVCLNTWPERKRQALQERRRKREERSKQADATKL
ncbi:hypothetical protein EXIGLDRAFT_726976, partial [Exidia glandulosa HHB12029]